ncbi:MAG: hypothetical protein ACTTKD_07650 [Peptoanaerobacter stomatis]|uniref:hypothetical protein n=1 Tax=Peptoanaerobacter stomatis TaxID=796937 RepID=UPI003FA1503F
MFMLKKNNVFIMTKEDIKKTLKRPKTISDYKTNPMFTQKEILNAFAVAWEKRNGRI